MRVGARILFSFSGGGDTVDAHSSVLSGLVGGPLAHTRGSVLDALVYRGGDRLLRPSAVSRHELLYTPQHENAAP